jgi:Gpi18-like mannosyltransferase
MLGPLLPLVVLVFVIRLLFSFLPSFTVDMGTWFSWADRLAKLGLARFYSDSVWTQYTPGFLYWLWFGGRAGWVNDFLIKTPTILADVLTGLLIWKVISKKNKKLALFSFLFYSLNPVVIFNGSVWGQIDGILTLFLFLSVFFLIYKQSISLAGFFMGVAFLIKPQALALAIPLTLIAVNKFKSQKLIRGSLVAIMTILVGSLPFFPNNPILGLPDLIVKMGKHYSYTSVFAFNTWSLVGMWKPDQLFFWWGLGLYLAAVIAILFVYKNRLKNVPQVFLFISLFLFAFFLFPTRVHERYLFPFFAFFLTAAGLLKNKKLFATYFVLSFLHLVNLYYPYAYYTDNFLRSEVLLEVIGFLAPLIGSVFLLIFIMILFRDYKKKFKLKIKTHYLLLIILVFSLLTHLIFLSSPKNEYFDEVYHAFTARRILHHDPRAWEWWNTPPEGYAFEWTHPPLAKLGMVAGMLIFGENSFGWRISGALLGVGSVYLTYLIARRLFKDKMLGILAAAVFSLDGLPLVMSRIGMNDSYFLFFTLLTLYLFLREKSFLSALSFGLALASKWSAVWVIPVLFILCLNHRKKFEVGLVWFLALPPLVYLATYIPMFLSGHNFNVFIEMQKQMWWYHTGLKATHPYSSPWWSWPLMMRPVYLYTKEVAKETVSRIYAMGNPIVFWFGLVSVIISTILSYLERNKKLGLIVFGYLVFFVPWAISPRIMFLYHYLPAIPFLSIATAYVLKKYPKLILPFFVFSLLFFVYFLPHLIGLPIPEGLDKNYYWFSSWR